MQGSLNQTATMATAHCLLGCGIGEVTGMVLATTFGWGNAASVAVAIVLAFTFGYLLTMLPLLRSGMSFRRAAPVALAADTVSITIMEIVDNVTILAIPGAITASLSSALFWASLFGSLAVAYIFAWPVNRYMVARGKGHAHH